MMYKSAKTTSITHLICAVIYLSRSAFSVDDGLYVRVNHTYLYQNIN